jgi:outer membrane lipoprotein-sorting protein
MSFLRTVPTRRLLALLAGVVVAIAGCTAIAVAASGSGRVPPRKPLARAIHSALSSPMVNGITARVTFTNHLIDSSDIRGGDPILKGATGRVWVSNNRFRLELQSDNGDAQLVANNRSFWAYDPSRKTVYQGTLPAGQDKATANKRTRAKRDAVPSVASIQSQLNKAARHLLISGATPGNIAGRPAYSVRVSPKQNGGLLGGVQLAWDAAHGVPLKVGLYARGNSSPVLELKVTKISYTAIHASTFSMSPPAGAKRVNISTSHSAKDRAAGRNRHAKAVTGVGAVAKRLSFRLHAPSTLVGRTRQDVMLLGSGGDGAALLTYGRGLDGVVVLEQTTKSASGFGQSTGASQSNNSKGAERRGLTLPTVSVNGTTAQQLQTPLGTLVRFTRAGVTYTVVGSVPAATADGAARGL